MSSATAENIVYHWFRFLTLDGQVFNHSTISYFIEWIRRESFAAIVHGLNEELLRLGLPSLETYADSSLVMVNVKSHQLSRSGLTVAESGEQPFSSMTCSCQVNPGLIPAPTRTEWNGKRRSTTKPMPRWDMHFRDHEETGRTPQHLISPSGLNWSVTDSAG